MADICFPGKISANNSFYPNFRHKQKLGKLMHDINRLDAELYKLNDIRASFRNTSREVSGLASLLQKIKKAQQEKFVLQEEINKLSKREEVLRNNPMLLAFTQFKNRRNQAKITETIENPFLVKFEEGLN